MKWYGVTTTTLNRMNMVLRRKIILVGAKGMNSVLRVVYMSLICFSSLLILIYQRFLTESCRCPEQTENFLATGNLYLTNAYDTENVSGHDIYILVTSPTVHHICVRIPKHNLCREGLMSGFPSHLVYCSYNRIWSGRYFRPSLKQSSTSNPLQINQAWIDHYNCVLIRLLNHCCLLKRHSYVHPLFNLWYWLNCTVIWNWK